MSRISRHFRLGLCVTSLLSLGAILAPEVGSMMETAPHWSIRPVPGDGDALSAVSCYTASRCVGVSIGSRQVITSTDGGATWKVREAPPAVAMGFTSLSCSPDGICWATAVLGALGQDGAAILRSDDGGIQWRIVHTVSAPGNALYRFNDVSCITLVNCLVGGTTGRTGFILATTDGGVRWRRAALPPQPVYGSITSATCVSVQKCFALQGEKAQIYISTDRGMYWRAQSVPKNFRLYEGGQGTSSGLSAISCGSTTFCVVGGFIARPLLQATTEPVKWVTNDGGASWSFIAPFAQTGAKSQFAISNGAISCYAKRSCELGLYYGYLYRTLDEGASWQRVQTSPNLDSNVLSLSCNSSRHCLAAVISNFPSTKLFQGSLWIYR